MASIDYEDVPSRIVGAWWKWQTPIDNIGMSWTPWQMADGKLSFLAAIGLRCFQRRGLLIWSSSRRYPGRPVLRSGCYGGWTLSDSLALGYSHVIPAGFRIANSLAGIPISFI